MLIQGGYFGNAKAPEPSVYYCMKRCGDLCVVPRKNDEQ